MLYCHPSYRVWVHYSVLFLVVMQNAKRMVLVDEKLLQYEPILQHFRTKQDLSWINPVEQSVKTSISKQMKSTLDDPEIPDDIKAKTYRQSLNRFLQSKRKVTEEPTIDQLLDFGPEEKKIDVTPTPQKKKRKSKRIRKKPQRYADIDWEQW